MLKTDEVTDPNSCLNRADDDEPIFVLLARDASAPGTVRAWVEKRIGSGKNRPDDPQMVSALAEADRMERWAAARKAKKDAKLVKQFGG